MRTIYRLLVIRNKDFMNVMLMIIYHSKCIC